MKRVHQVLNFFTGVEAKSKRDMVHNEMKGRHMAYPPALRQDYWSILFMRAS